MNGIKLMGFPGNLDHLADNALPNLIASLFLLVGVIVLRKAVHRILLKQKKVPSETRRRWMVQTRNFLFLVTFFGLVIIWASEIRSLALSLVAVAVALVIATKELILCVAGTFVKASSRAFALGDRIEVKEMRGDVVDQGLFTTTLLEIGPKNLTHQYTGRSVTIPNSLFLTESIVNESFTADYVLHVFTIPIPRTEDWKKAGELVLRASAEACRPFEKDAQQHMVRHHQSRGLVPPNLTPRVHYKVQDKDTINLVVRLVTPARQKGRVEQEVTRMFLSEFKTKA